MLFRGFNFSVKSWYLRAEKYFSFAVDSVCNATDRGERCCSALRQFSGHDEHAFGAVLQAAYGIEQYFSALLYQSVKSLITYSGKIPTENYSYSA